MAGKKAPAKKSSTVDRFDESWEGVKMNVKDKNGKPIGPNSAKKPAAGKAKKK